MVIKIISRVYAVVLLVMCSLCVIHTVISRSPYDFLSILKYIAPVGVFLFISNHEADENVGVDGKIIRRYPSSREALEGAVLGSLLLIPVGVVIFSVYSSAIDFVTWIKHPNLNEYAINLISACTVLIFGHILFIFRQKYRSTYGATELLIGIAIAMNNAQSLFRKGDFDLTLVFAFITAGVYLVVRGLDNIHEGSKEKKSGKSESV